MPRLSNLLLWLLESAGPPATAPHRLHLPRWWHHMWGWLEAAQIWLRELLQQNPHWAFLVISVWLLASGFGLPFPEDVPLILAGAACQTMDWWPAIWIMVPLCVLSILGADCTLYWMGRRYGHHVPRLPLLRRYLTPARLARAEKRFREHGGKTLFTARFLPGLRTPLFFTAGVFRIPFWKLLLFDGSAGMISIPTLVILGYLFPFEKVKQTSGHMQLVIFAGLVLAGAGLFAWHRVKKKKEAQEEAVPPVSPTPPVPPAPRVPPIPPIPPAADAARERG